MQCFGCVVPLSDSCVKHSGGWSRFIEDSMLSLIGSAGAEICVKPSGGWSKFIEDSMLSLIGSAGAKICVKPSGGWSKFIEDSMLSLIGSAGAEILDIMEYKLWLCPLPHRNSDKWCLEGAGRYTRSRAPVPS